MGTPEKKMVLGLDLHDDMAKKKAMKAVSSLLGIDSIAMDMNEKKMTVVGVVDPVAVVTKLRKSWHTEIVSIGPARDPPKMEQKKEEPPPKNKDEFKKEENKEPPPSTDAGGEAQVAELFNMYRAYNPNYMTTHYVVHITEDDPNLNLCCIC